MLNISNDEIKALVPMKDAIECMKNAFSDFDSGDFIAVSYTHLTLPTICSV